MTRLEMTYAEITAAHLKANNARLAVYDLADNFSWETIGRELVSRMTASEAEEFLEDFISLYS